MQIPEMVSFRPDEQDMRRLEYLEQQLAARNRSVVIKFAIANLYREVKNLEEREAVRS